MSHRQKNHGQQDQPSIHIQIWSNTQIEKTQEGNLVGGGGGGGGILWCQQEDIYNAVNNARTVLIVF